MLAGLAVLAAVLAVVPVLLDPAGQVALRRLAVQSLVARSLAVQSRAVRNPVAQSLEARNPAARSLALTPQRLMPAAVTKSDLAWPSAGSLVTLIRK
jgi:hypothetical protein